MMFQASPTSSRKNKNKKSSIDLTENTLDINSPSGYFPRAIKKNTLSLVYYLRLGFIVLLWHKVFHLFLSSARGIKNRTLGQFRMVSEDYRAGTSTSGTSSGTSSGTRKSSQALQPPKLAVLDDEAIQKYKKRLESFTSEERLEEYHQERSRGNECFNGSLYEAAVQHYTHCILSQPHNVVGYSNRAAALLKMNKYTQALEDCNEALKIDPKHTKAKYRRGMALHHKNRFREALQDFEDVVRTDANNFLANHFVSKIREVLYTEPRDIRLRASNTNTNGAHLEMNDVIKIPEKEYRVNPTKYSNHVPLNEWGWRKTFCSCVSGEPAFVRSYRRACEAKKTGPGAVAGATGVVHQRCRDNRNRSNVKAARALRDVTMSSAQVSASNARTLDSLSKNGTADLSSASDESPKVPLIYDMPLLGDEDAQSEGKCDVDVGAEASLNSPTSGPVGLSIRSAVECSESRSGSIVSSIVSAVPTSGSFVMSTESIVPSIECAVHSCSGSSVLSSESIVPGSESIVPGSGSMRASTMEPPEFLSTLEPASSEPIRLQPNVETSNRPPTRGTVETREESECGHVETEQNPQVHGNKTNEPTNEIVESIDVTVEVEPRLGETIQNPRRRTSEESTFSNKNEYAENSKRSIRPVLMETIQTELEIAKDNERSIRAVDQIETVQSENCTEQCEFVRNSERSIRDVNQIKSAQTESEFAKDNERSIRAVNQIETIQSESEIAKDNEPFIRPVNQKETFQFLKPGNQPGNIGVNSESQVSGHVPGTSPWEALKSHSLCMPRPVSIVSLTQIGIFPTEHNLKSVELVKEAMAASSKNGNDSKADDRSVNVTETKANTNTLENHVEKVAKTLKSPEKRDNDFSTSSNITSESSSCVSKHSTNNNNINEKNANYKKSARKKVKFEAKAAEGEELGNDLNSTSSETSWESFTPNSDGSGSMNGYHEVVNGFGDGRSEPIVKALSKAAKRHMRRKIFKLNKQNQESSSESVSCKL